MGDSEAARFLIQRALEDLRMMSRRPDLCSDQARRTMFAIADAVHNLTDVLEPDTDATLASRLYADDPAAQEWIRDQLAAFEDSRAGVPDVALRWNREGICPRWPDPYAAHPDRLRVSPMS